MADRYAFQSPFSRGAGGDPWFTVGSIAVNTTTFVTGLGLLGIIIQIVSPTLTSLLILRSSALSGGQVWRFITYPIPPGDDFFWALLGLLFFYMIGTQFESLIGRRPFAGMIIAIVVIPAVLGALVAFLTGTDIFSFGLSLPFLGIAAGFSAAMPQARSFFNIPFWVIVAFIFVVQLLSALNGRSPGAIIMLLATGGLGLVITRSLGFSTVEWIPSVALPSSMTSNGAPSPPRDSKKRGRKAKKSRRQKKGGSHLRSVSSQPNRASEAEIDELLDQVNAFGLDSLTKEQKQTLERHAQEMRKRRDG